MSKKIISIVALLFSCILLSNAQSMDKAFRKPAVEEGDHNIILQNRLGNRLTVMTFGDHTQLEFTYKPNAERRKEFWARNFSNRDNQTVLFPEFIFPDIFTKDVIFEYDPFTTRIKVNAESGAKNTITLVNVADENCFAIAARSPLLLAFKPHVKFEQQNGLLTERFTERGEEIISFIKFPGFEANRFRVLKDGTYLLQLLENDVIYIGGEENPYQVDRVIRKLENLSLVELISRNETKLEPILGFSDIKINNNEKFQKVLDFNKRMYYSMLDEGGASFGALARIYYLIWVRDCSMSTSLMARGGSTYGIKKLAPFLLNNPSMTRRDDGTTVPEFIQILGSRWGKSEDDGIFYALLALFTYFETTGNDDLLYSEAFEIALESIDRFMEKTWDEDLKMVGSDTRGETSLKSSPYFGYDVVNGEMYHNEVFMDGNDINLERSYSLYNQVNTYNLLIMANVLLSQNQQLDNGRSERYARYAKELKKTLRSKFVSPKGTLYSGFDQFSDGSSKWTSFGKGCDYWEHAWATSLGPYAPVPELQLKSAIEVRNDWAKYRNIGYCPWNTLSRTLYEYNDINSFGYEKMLAVEIDEALSLTKRYPMIGAVTEYQGETEGWRALPFQIGALYYSMSAQMIQNMPMGIGVRASNFVDSVTNYQFRLSRIDGKAEGKGDIVKSYRINGKELKHTLQLPASHLRPGHNELTVTRGEANDLFRIYSSTAEMLEYIENDNQLTFDFNNPVESQIIIENFNKIKNITIKDTDNNEIPYTTTELNGKTLLEFPSKGYFSVNVSL
ncbi:MAG: hypothetical protein PUB21_05695 [Bacteroidales bacterium]|nr:hypothetical protein [Bacteroidales bacterium]